jgi:hypothetical protein
VGEGGSSRVAALCGCDPKSVSRWLLEETEPVGHERAVILYVTERIRQLDRTDPDKASAYVEQIRRIARPEVGMEKLIAFGLDNAKAVNAYEPPVEVSPLGAERRPASRSRAHYGLRAGRTWTAGTILLIAGTAAISYGVYRLGERRREGREQAALERAEEMTQTVARLQEALALKETAHATRESELRVLSEKREEACSPARSPAQASHQLAALSECLGDSDCGSGRDCVAGHCLDARAGERFVFPDGVFVLNDADEARLRARAGFRRGERDARVALDALYCATEETDGKIAAAKRVEVIRRIVLEVGVPREAIEETISEATCSGGQGDCQRCRTVIVSVR